MCSVSDVTVSVGPDVSLCVSSDICPSMGGGVYQIVQLSNGLYQLVSSTVPASQGFLVTTETESRESLSTSVSTDTSLSPDTSLLTNTSTPDTSGCLNQSFQESLDALFNSIHPNDDEPEPIDQHTPETAADYRYGDLLMNNQPPQTPPPFSNIPLDSPLASHPFFCDLRDTLHVDCQQSTLPSNLFQTLGNHTHHMTIEEHSLKVRLQKLQEADVTERVQELSSLFELHVSSIEQERAECLANQTSAQYKTWLNSYFDHQKNQVMERVKRSLQVMEDSMKQTSRSETRLESGTSWMSGVRQRPTLSRKAIQIMEQWYQSNLQNPYPSGTVVEAMALAGSITTSQVKKWFGNKRNRGGNTRSMTEIARRKHRLRHSGKWQLNTDMIGNLAHYL